MKEFQTPYSIKFHRPQIPGMSDASGYWLLTKRQPDGTYKPVEYDPNLDVGGQYVSRVEDYNAPPRKLIDDLNNLIKGQREDFFKQQQESTKAKLSDDVIEIE